MQNTGNYFSWNYMPNCRSLMHTMILGTCIAVMCGCADTSHDANEVSACWKDPAESGYIGEDATRMLTWDNVYDWSAGHGYYGWDSATSGAEPSGYSFATGLPAGSGLWVWPTGGRSYSSGHAEWIYEAPGTTRALSARVEVTYPPRLLSHHCIAIVLSDDAGSERDAVRFCKPPQAPKGNPASVTLALADPSSDSPKAKYLAVRLELPCTKKNPKACSKHIPVAEAVQNGLQVRRVEMRLVDDDLPVLAPASEWYELRDQYVNGQGQHNLTLAANDAGSGIERIAFEEFCVGEIASVDAPCDPTHNTPELGNRICPASFSAEIIVDATKLSEGKHIFRETARDLAGNIGVSDSWAVFVDRTGPSTPTNFELRYFEPVDREATVSWDHPIDPTLADGSPGSGTTRSEARYRLNGGPFSEWQEAPDDQIDIDGANEGDAVIIEARAIDGVGNVSAVGSGTLRLHALLEDPLVEEMAAEWFASEYGVDLVTAHAWLAVQNKAAGLGEDVAGSAAGSGYAGIWFDNVARRLKVGLRSGTPPGPVYDLLAARGIASEADIVTTTYTQRELEQAKPAIEDALAELHGQGLVLISRDVSTNSIRIEVASAATTDQRATITQVAHDAPVNVTIVNSAEPSLSFEPLACKFPRADGAEDEEPGCDPPLRGGVRIVSERAGCTAGFIARSRSDNKPYVLTAGHCFLRVNEAWAAYDGSGLNYHTIGSVHNFVNGDEGDAGLISISETSFWKPWIRPYVFVTKSKTGSPSTRRDTTYRIRDVKFSAKGNIVCVSGATNGSHCGEVVNHDATKQHYVELKMCGVTKGDSGGPVFKHHTAYGIMVKRRVIDLPLLPPSCRVWAQGARTAENLLNINIVTSR